MDEISYFHCHCADRAEPGGLPADGAGHRGLQDQAVRPRPRHLAQRPQLLLQRLVEHPRLQAHEGLPQVRLLPGETRHWNGQLCR